MFRRAALTFLAFALCSATALPAADPAARALDSYLQELQLPDGVLANSNAANAANVTPYKASYAAIGLALGGDAPTALAFERWYVAHMNAADSWGPGCTIDDFTFTRTPFAMTATGKAGAMDAPAGVFLTAMRVLYATGDKNSQEWIATQERNARCIARAAYGLYQPAYHCTQAITGYNFCLTEDNFEVWRGLGDIAWLEDHVWGNASMAAAYEAQQSDIGVGLAQMWNPQLGTYNWARSILTGAFTRSAWSQFYPGSVTQLWPVIVGYAAPDDPRSIALWQSFKAAWPNAAIKSPVASPWPWIAVAAAKMGDLGFVNQYASCLNASYANQGYPYGWESADGGNMLTALVWAEEYARRHSAGSRRRGQRLYCVNRYARGAR
jgi:hypothetical protein